MMKAGMLWTWKFLKYLAHRYAYDNLSNIAAMLTVTSLLALVPLLAVIFTILSAMPYVQNLAKYINASVIRTWISLK